MGARHSHDAGDLAKDGTDAGCDTRHDGAGGFLSIARGTGSVIPTLTRWVYSFAGFCAVAPRSPTNGRSCRGSGPLGVFASTERLERATLGDLFLEKLRGG